MGINNTNCPTDEYNGYTPKIFRLVVEQADTETIAMELNKIETTTMGLTGSIKHCREVANKIIKIRDS